MKNKIHSVILYFILIMAIYATGCAAGKFGRFHETVPNGLIGQNKLDIVKTLGVPDAVVTISGTEYWKYRNTHGLYFLIYGATGQKDLILEFKDDKVFSSYTEYMGHSAGLFLPQGAVAR